MKTTPIIVFLVSVGLFFSWEMADAEKGKRPELIVPMPADTQIIPPTQDVIKEIAAFSGVWQGIWTDYAAEIVLVVEEINDEEAAIIYCLGESAGVYRVPASCERYKAIVATDILQIEFNIGETQKFTFRMDKSLDQIEATKITPLDIIEITMTRVK